MLWLGIVYLGALFALLAQQGSVETPALFWLALVISADNLSGGIAIRNANLAEMLLPAAFAVLTGILIVFIGRYTLAKLPKVKTVDAIATALANSTQHDPDPAR